MDDEGTVSKTVSDSQLKEMAKIIVQGMKDGSINTRSLNTVKSPRFTQLMGQLRAVATPPQTVKGEKLGSTTNPAPTKPPRRKSPTRRHWLDVSRISVPDSYPLATKQLVEELTLVDVQKMPNIAFITIRSVLEKTIKSYADAKNEDIQAGGNASNGYAQLHHVLKWLETYIAAHGPKALLQPIRQIRGGSPLWNYSTSSNALNAINHNHQFLVAPDNVFDCWNSIESLLRELTNP